MARAMIYRHSGPFPLDYAAQRLNPTLTARAGVPILETLSTAPVPGDGFPGLTECWLPEDGYYPDDTLGVVLVRGGKVIPEGE